MTKSPERRQVVRYAFHKLDPAWRRLTAERQASAKIEFGETLERYHGRLLLRPYGLVGIRGDCDFLLWQVAEDLDALVELQTALNRTDLGAYEFQTITGRFSGDLNFGWCCARIY